MDLLEKAYSFAYKKHDGQLDKAGNPYITHPIWVSKHCVSYNAKVVGLLHDTLEDTNTTYDELVKEFGVEIADAVLCITKRDNEDYLSFVRRTMTNPISMEVKIRDIRHNMDLSRIPREPSDEDFKRLDNKYKPAYILLTGHPLMISEQLNIIDEGRALELLLDLSNKDLPNRVLDNIRYIILGYSNAVSDELKEYIEKEI